MKTGKYSSWIGFFLVSCIFLQGCASRSTEEVQKKVFLDGIRGAQSFAVLGVNDYVVTHFDDTKKKGFVTRVKKGEVMLFPNAVERPRGIATDPRRMRVLVTDGWKIHYIHAKNPTVDSKEFLFPEDQHSEGGYLDAIYYSLFNRKAYFLVQGKGQIWSWDPIADKHELVLDQGEYFKGRGQEVSKISVSADGAVLRLGTRVLSSQVGSASLYDYNLRSKKLREIAADSRWKNIQAIEYRSSHLLLLDEATHRIWAVNMKKESEVKDLTPVGFISNIDGFTIDLNSALVLPKFKGGQSVQFRKYPLPVRF